MRYSQFIEQTLISQKVMNLFILGKIAPISVQSELVEMRQLCEALHQRMNKLDC